MRRASKWIVSSLVAAGLCAAVSTNPVFAKRDPDVAKALKEQYPDAKTEITRSRDINGVKVNDVKITTKDGDSTAEVTEYGDFLLWGMPRNASSGNTISAAAAETLQGLFKGDLKNVDVYKTVNYLVDVQTSKKTFRLRLDPVGRLRDVDNSAQMKQEQASLEKASGGDAKKAEQYATKYMDGAKVENVYKTDDAGNFFLVDMKNKNGKDAKITVNNTGRILSEMEEIDRNDIPKPVSEAIDRLFSGEKVQRAYREETEYYQFQENTSGGDRVTIKIRPNGDVLSIHNPAAQQDDRDAAQTARSRESGSSDNKSSDRSNRNRNRGGGQ